MYVANFLCKFSCKAYRNDSKPDYIEKKPTIFFGMVWILRILGASFAV